MSALKAAWIAPRNTVAQPTRNSASGVMGESGRVSFRISYRFQTPSLDQALGQPAPAPEPALEAGHPAVVALVIIAKKV